jgi:hypothetical protein
MGESGHLLMVQGLVGACPERCIAGICMKNPGSPPKDKGSPQASVPMLWTLGTGQEWKQTQSDIRTSWNAGGSIGDNIKAWAKHVTDLQWPLSIAVEAGTGHFYCTDQMAELFHTYINAACKARLSDDGGATLKPVNLAAGVVAYLPFTGSEDLGAVPYSSSTTDRPWFFDAATAQAAQDVSKADWTAQTQLPAVEKGENITVTPYSLNSVTQIKVVTDSEFGVEPILADKIPQGFVGAGEPLATTAGTPVAEWICGQFAPVGGNKFKIALDRTYRHGANYIVLRKDAGDHVRFSVQPIQTTLVENSDGKPQTITFDKIADVKDGTATVTLSAKSDSGLPVSFYVQAGPATVDGTTLTLTKVPPRATYPVEVTVGAWQWGRPGKFKTAPIETQVFQITK